VPRHGPFEPGNKYAFKPGQSGNPGGISKDVWSAMKLASSSCLEMIEILLSIARNAKATAGGAQGCCQFHIGSRRHGEGAQCPALTIPGRPEAAYK